MVPPPYGPPYRSVAPPNTLDRDLEHLRLLEIFHYVLAAIVAVSSLLPLLYAVFGVAMVAGALPGPPATPSSSGFPLQFGWFFVVMGVGFTLVGEAFAALNFYAARCLKRRTSYVLVAVVAGLNCLNMPFGTALGVATLIVITKPHVKAWFDGGARPAS